MMIDASPFELKIALIGHVSAGKTTVLNALLRDKYGEVSVKRTTAGVNYFRITTTTTETKKAPGDAKKAQVSCQQQQHGDEGDGNGDIPYTDQQQWRMMVDGEPRCAGSTLQEISADNAVLRAASSSSDVQEKTFDVELDGGLCEMREDTKLVLVDIPGINEAGSSSKYRDYVAEKWSTFDCAVVIMDARQGVNSEDSIQLLHFVMSNLQEQKDIPTIILFNKVDDPEDEEQVLLVDEARSEVERIFNVTCRKKALETILSGPIETKELPQEDRTAAAGKHGSGGATLPPDAPESEASSTAPTFGSAATGSPFGTPSTVSGRRSFGTPAPSGGGLGFSTLTPFGAAAAPAFQIGTGSGSQPQKGRRIVQAKLPIRVYGPTTTSAFKYGPASSSGCGTPPWNANAIPSASATPATSTRNPFEFGRKSTVFPVFLPLSARNAYIYQTASRMDLERFKTFEKDLVEKLGREQVGMRRWRTLSEEEKYTETFQVLSDPKEIEQGLKHCNFDKLMLILAHSIGGAGVQLGLIQKQIEAEAGRLVAPRIATKLRILQEKQKKLGSKDTGFCWLKKLFWEHYSTYEAVVVGEIDEVAKLNAFARPMDELIAYHGIVRELEVAEEEKLIIDRFKKLVNQHANTLLSRKELIQQSKLSDKDCSLILGSMLLVSHETHFAEHFGLLKILLEARYHKYLTATSIPFPPKWWQQSRQQCFICQSPPPFGQPHRPVDRCKTCNVAISFTRQEKHCRFVECKQADLDENCMCQSCGCVYLSSEETNYTLEYFLRLHFVRGAWSPVFPEIYEQLVNVSVAESPSDPEHFGHLIWSFCRFMESIAK